MVSQLFLLAFGSKSCLYVCSQTGSRRIDEGHPLDRHQYHGQQYMSATFLSSSVISFSQSRFNKCAKSRSSFCLMISTNSYVLKSFSHTFRACEDAPSSKSRHINLSPAGFNWYKSPTAIILKPPKNCFCSRQLLQTCVYKA